MIPLLSGQRLVQAHQQIIETHLCPVLFFLFQSFADPAGGVNQYVGPGGGHIL